MVSGRVPLPSARPAGLGRNTTPAMAAGISDHLWTAEEIAALVE